MLSGTLVRFRRVFFVGDGGKATKSAITKVVASAHFVSENKGLRLPQQANANSKGCAQFAPITTLKMALTN
eukprot:m.4279 g.4279  ORF g.4279 m.4279 type:complete len:71 (+) comp6822_c0_seq1:1039-1251(+)